MSTRVDPIVTGRSRSLSVTCSVTLTATVAFPGTANLGSGKLQPRFISNSSGVGIAAGAPPPAFGASAGGTTIYYGYTGTGGVFVELGRFDTVDVGFAYSPITPPPSGRSTTPIPWGTFTWSYTVDITISGIFGELLYLLTGGTDAQLTECLLPSSTGSRVVTVNGTPYSSATYAAVVADWNTRVLSVVTPQSMNMYPTGGGTRLSNGPLLAVSGYSDNDIFAYYDANFDAGQAHSTAFSISLGTGLEEPASLPVFTCPIGSGSGGAVALNAPSPTQAFSGRCSAGVSPLQTIVTKVTCRNMDGELDTLPRDVEIFLNDGDRSKVSSLYPFKLLGMTGSASLPLTLGGRSQVCLFEDTTTTYSQTIDNDLKDAAGMSSVSGLPVPCFPSDPVLRPVPGSTYTASTSMRGRSSFDFRLPLKAGGLRIRHKPELNLFSSPWPIGGTYGWQIAFSPSSAAVSTSGPSGAYLRITRTSSSGTPQAFAAIPTPATEDLQVIGYRFWRIRYRSVGSANKPLTFGIQMGVSYTLLSPLTTGADGEWVETEIDTQRDGLVNTADGSGQPLPRPYRGTTLYLAPREIRFSGFGVGVYEIEVIKGFRKYDSLVSVMRAAPSVIGTGGFDSVGQTVRSFHAATDSMVALSSYLAAFPKPSIDVLVNRINNLRWPAWEAQTVQPLRGDKPAVSGTRVYALQPIDATDSECFAGWLAGGGMFRNGSNTLDKDAATASGEYLTIPVQPALRTIALYPGCGEFLTDSGGGFSTGAYGLTTTMDWLAITRAQVVGILTGGKGSKVKSRIIAGGLAGSGTVGSDTGSATCTRASGYTPTPAPNAPMGSKIRVTAEDGLVVAWPAAGAGQDPYATLGTTSPWDHYDVRILDVADSQDKPVGRKRIFAMFVTAPVIYYRSPRGLNTRQGGYYGSVVVTGTEGRGRIQWRRTRGEQVPRTGAWPVTAFVSTPADTEADGEPWPWYDDRDGSLHVLYTRAAFASAESIEGEEATTTAVREAVSFDDGATWTESVIASDGARHGQAVLGAGANGGCLRAWFKPGADYPDDPDSGVIVGTYQSAGDDSPSAPFVFRYLEGLDTGDMVVDDDTFALTYSGDSGDRFRLFVMMGREPEPSGWSSADDGRTWTRDVPRLTPVIGGASAVLSGNDSPILDVILGRDTGTTAP